MSPTKISAEPIAIATPSVSLWTIFAAYLQVGLTAFGFAILQKLKALVLTRHWLNEEEMNDGLALVQLYPGPIMVDFTAYAGYKLRGVAGALAATVGFILPTTVLMLVLSSLYFATGQLPWVKPIFVGLEALVIGIILDVTLDFGKRSVKGRVEALIALASFAALVFKLNAILIVLLALALGAIFLRPPKSSQLGTNSPTPSLGTARSQTHWLGIGLVVLVVLAGVGFSMALSSPVGRASLSFFKIGAVAFGNGMTILPLIQADAVDSFHWLNVNEFVDGIALSQITPGPFLVISTFIGYKLGGVWAALLTTFAMFAPSFAMTLIFTEIFSRVKDLTAVKGALAGVLAAFVGLLASVLLQLGKVGIVSPMTLVFAASAFIAVRYFKLDILWVFLAGLIVWGGLLALGWTI